jgi:hypothetical protein
MEACSMGREEVQHYTFLITSFEEYSFSPSGTAAFLQGK